MWKTRLINLLAGSLQKKLMLALMAITTVVMGVGGFFLFASQQQGASAALEARATFMANMLSKSLSGPLWNVDLETIADQIETVMSDPEIHSVAILEAGKKQPIASSQRYGQAVDGIEREFPVVYVHQAPRPPVELGKVHIVYTRSRMNQALKKTRVVILAGLLFLLVSIFSATYVLLRRTVKKPVGDLLAMAQRIADGDLDVRIPVTSRDEIGLLSDKFNYMTDKLKQTMDGLGKSEQKYRNINESLETRIQERTETLQGRLAELDKSRRAMLNIMEDLEAAKKASLSATQKIQAMGQAMADALVMVDDQGKVLFWNEAAEKLFGYTASEAMGMDFHEMAAPLEAKEKAWAGMRQFAATGQGVVFGNAIETTAINRRGETFPVEVNLSPFQLDEKWFVVGTVHDITERKQSQNALQQRMEELERFSRVTINREKQMIKLKEEINLLLEEEGKGKKYKIVA